MPRASRSMSTPSSGKHAITRILFSVSVPVLSVQITVAAPMVSQAWSLRTRLFSFSILRMLRARLTVTLMGSPSGTATTMRATAIMMELISTWKKPNHSNPPTLTTVR